MRFEEGKIYKFINTEDETMAFYKCDEITHSIDGKLVSLRKIYSKGNICAELLCGIERHLNNPNWRITETNMGEVTLYLLENE